MLIKEGEESCTTNLWQQCCFEKVVKDEARKLSTVPRNHYKKYRLPAAHHRVVGGQGQSQCPTCARIVTVSRWKTTFGWSQGKKHTTWWCAICGEKYDWKEPNSVLVVQTGETVNQAKVFKPHAASQGLCVNLINALTLLENQQEDGDGLVQNIVANLGEVGRKEIAECLRNFIQVDNHRALEVGHLREGLKVL